MMDSQKEKLNEILKNSRKFLKKTQGIWRKTQGNFRKTQEIANCQLALAAEKCPKKSLKGPCCKIGNIDLF